MSANDRFERRLPVILDSLAPTRAPEYFDDILGQVDRTRQRPGWTFPERWLPVSALTNRLAVTPRIPMRAAIAVMSAHRRPGRRRPAPRGQPPARARCHSAPRPTARSCSSTRPARSASGNPVDGTSSIIVAGSGESTAHHVAGRHPPRLPVERTTLVVSDAAGSDPIVVATDGLLAQPTWAGRRTASRHRRPVDREARGVRRRRRRAAEPDARLRQRRRLAQRPRRPVPAAGRDMRSSSYGPGPRASASTAGT